MKPPNVTALETKLGVTLVQCPACECWHRDSVLCGFVGCERLRAHVAKQEELKCAACLVPGEVVDDEGRVADEGLGGMRHDQVGGWLPGVPVGDTFWGYSSVPSADVRWWKALPTYDATAKPKKTRKKAGGVV